MPPDALASFLTRQQRSVLSKIGSGESAQRAIYAPRWVRECVDDTGWPADVVNGLIETLAADVTRAVGHFPDSRSRVAAARAVYAYYAENVRAAVEVNTTGRHMLYRLYDALGRLLYIGITDRGPNRLVEHYKSKPWFGDVVRVEFERFDTRSAVEDRERITIHREAPIYNVQHNEGRHLLAGAGQ